MSKRRVEGCLILPAPHTRRAAHFLQNSSGVWAWPKYGYLLRYDFWRTSPTTARLDLRDRQRIDLEATSPNYGGVRWWYLCSRCGRRASRLYLPNREYLFLCRVCHNLSYESAQSSRARYYQLFKDSARQLPKGYCTASYFREAIRAGIGGRLVTDLVGQAVVRA